MADFDTIQMVKQALHVKRAALMEFGGEDEPYVGLGDEKVEPAPVSSKNEEQEVTKKDEAKEPKKKKKAPKMKKAPAADSTLAIKASSSEHRNAILDIAELANRLR